MKSVFQGNNIFGNIRLTHTLAQTKFTIMKKILTLLIPVLILMVACNNKTASDATATTNDTATAIAAPATQPIDTDSTNTDGNPGNAAKVFEDVTLAVVSGAKVVAVENGTIVETAYTADDGYYAFTKLTSGHTYTYTVSKTGYTPMAKTAAYTGTTTLPLFNVVKK